jgi:hypothetical protein
VRTGSATYIKNLCLSLWPVSESILAKTRFLERDSLWGGEEFVVDIGVKRVVNMVLVFICICLGAPFFVIFESFATLSIPKSFATLSIPKSFPTPEMSRMDSRKNKQGEEYEGYEPIC